MRLDEEFKIQDDFEEYLFRKYHLSRSQTLGRRILALRVELGELANEWQGFKFWKTKQEVNRKKLESEYVDCLHFAISLGIDYGASWSEDFTVRPALSGSLMEQFNYIFSATADMRSVITWRRVFEHLLGLGQMLDIPEDTMRKAYRRVGKNNYARQIRHY